jgi:hypothetical protein
VKRRDLPDFTEDELRAALAEPGGRERLEAYLIALYRQDREHAEQLRQRHEAFVRALKLDKGVAERRGTLIRRVEGVLGTAEREL